MCTSNTDIAGVPVIAGLACAVLNRRAAGQTSVRADRRTCLALCQRPIVVRVAGTDFQIAVRCGDLIPGGCLAEAGAVSAGRTGRVVLTYTFLELMTLKTPTFPILVIECAKPTGIA